MVDAITILILIVGLFFIGFFFGRSYEVQMRINESDREKECR